MFARLLIALVAVAAGASLATQSMARNAAAEVQRSAVQRDSVETCVVQEGRLLRVTGVVSPDGRDTLVQGEKFSSRFPLTSPPYASQMPWYIARRPISFKGHDYAFDGREFVVSPPDLRLEGEFGDVPVFAISDQETVDVIFVPIRPGCVFTMYEQQS